MDNLYITPSEFARRLCIDSSTVRRWINEGRVKVITMKNPHRNHYRIPISEVSRFEKELVENNEC